MFSCNRYRCSRFICMMIMMLCGDSVAKWLACWTRAQKGLGSNHSHDAVG